MNFGDVGNRIAFLSEPYMYIKPTIAYTPIEKVNRVYSNENYFNSSGFKDLKDRQAQIEEAKKNGSYSGRGAIFDILA